MKAGYLRCRYILLTPTTSRGDAGSYGDGTFAERKRFYGETLDISGDETIKADRLEAQATHKIRIRYDSEVTTKCRLQDIDSGETFDIISINNVHNRNREQLILARAAVDD